MYFTIAHLDFISPKSKSKILRKWDTLMTLHKVQVYLDREGASDLVAELVMKSCLSPSVFTEAVQLGIAFLEGGNPVIQRSLYNKLQSAETSAIFHDKIRESQK